MFIIIIIIIMNYIIFFYYYYHHKIIIPSVAFNLSLWNILKTKRCQGKCFKIKLERKEIYWFVSVFMKITRLTINQIIFK